MMAYKTTSAPLTGPTKVRAHKSVICLVLMWFMIWISKFLICYSDTLDQLTVIYNMNARLNSLVFRSLPGKLHHLNTRQRAMNQIQNWFAIRVTNKKIASGFLKKLFVDLKACFFLLSRWVHNFCWREFPLSNPWYK